MCSNRRGCGRTRVQAPAPAPARRHHRGRAVGVAGVQRGGEEAAWPPRGGVCASVRPCVWCVCRGVGGWKGGDGGCCCQRRHRCRRRRLAVAIAREACRRAGTRGGRSSPTQMAPRAHRVVRPGGHLGARRTSPSACDPVAPLQLLPRRLRPAQHPHHTRGGRGGPPAAIWADYSSD